MMGGGSRAGARVACNGFGIPGAHWPCTGMGSVGEPLLEAAGALLMLGMAPPPAGPGGEGAAGPTNVRWEAALLDPLLLLANGPWPGAAAAGPWL